MEYKDSYDRDEHIFEMLDAQECGSYGSFDTKTGESEVLGKLYSCLVDNGEKITREWLTDKDVEKHCPQ